MALMSISAQQTQGGKVRINSEAVEKASVNLL